jgi:diguanylate cyclase (GGDEF)-like protein/putative nucleotidyltransferase with HDIG domain
MPSIRNIGGGLPPRLRRYVLATIATGVPVAAVAVAVAAVHPPGASAGIGIAAFFLLTMLAEWRPVPIDVEGKRLVSLAFIFIVSSQLLFGWEWSVVIGALGIGLAVTIEGMGPIRVLFNASVYAISGGLAALSLLADGGGHGQYALIALSVVAGGSIFVLVNVLLVCVAIALASDTTIRETFRDHLRHSGPVFAISIFVAAQAVILWRLSPPLMLLLSAPLFALTLYQRSSVRGRVAMEAASTDSLTGLRNRRAFEEDAEGTLTAPQVGRPQATLCLIDIDRFKQVNDRYGHLFGDAVLALLGNVIEEVAPGCGYRLGGDEFVLLLERRSHSEVLETVQSEFSRRQEGLPEHSELVTVSAGIAFYPEHADNLQSLRKRADMALYESKYNGRSRTTVYGTTAPLTLVQGATGQSAPVFLSDFRLLTVQRLVSLVDAIADASADVKGLLTPAEFSSVLDRWTALDSNHSRAVASLAGALARRLGVSGEELEDIEVAALLHDVGKIALPERILSKPGLLDADERTLVERHPIVGFELLRDLGRPQAATFVLHHHERWDGAGYPRGLAGADIPFGSRIILVADSFDALTSDRVYRRAVSVGAAIHEIQSESGRQFDPLVVSALHEHFAHPASDANPYTAVPEPEWSSSMSFS